MGERGPVRAGEGGTLIDLKVVPGARRDEIAGLLGDRLKVRVSAPPEGGKANKAVLALLAARLGVKAGALELVGGATSPEKSVLARGVEPGTAREALGL